MQMVITQAMMPKAVYSLPEPSSQSNSAPMPKENAMPITSENISL